MFLFTKGEARSIKNHIDFLMDIHNFHKVKQNWLIHNIGMKKKNKKIEFPGDHFKLN